MITRFQMSSEIIRTQEVKPYLMRVISTKAVTIPMSKLIRNSRWRPILCAAR